MHHDMIQDLAEVFISEGAFGRRIRELGPAISRDYTGKELVLAGVLRGASDD